MTVVELAKKQAIRTQEVCRMFPGAARKIVRRKSLDRRIKVMTEERDRIDAEVREWLDSHGAKVGFIRGEVAVQLVPWSRRAYKVDAKRGETVTYS